MISVVIPTLQKGLDALKALLNNLNNDNAVGEIIVIDNSLKGFEHNFEKVRFIIPTQNLFVNPSWNLGVSESKFDYVALFNDDVIVSDTFCSKILPYLSEDKGVFGSFGDDIKLEKTDAFFAPFKDDKKIKISPTDCYIDGFGIIMVGHKNAFPHIPDEMRVYSGDNYLFKMNSNNGKQNYLIYGVEIRHYGSLSSSCMSLNEIKLHDEKYYEDHFDPPKKYSFWERFLSVNIVGRHYVICFLGLRFRARRKLANPISP